MFQEFIDLCDEQYEYGLIEFKNGDIVNQPGENDGSAKVLSYAALAQFDKEMTLKVSPLSSDSHIGRDNVMLYQVNLMQFIQTCSALGPILQRCPCHP